MFKIIKIIFTLLLLFLLISYINNKIQLNNEENLRQPLGNLVEVNGKRMSIYSEGSGKKTLVFMSGGGTVSPILDFRSLYTLLSDEYKVVVVEKFGYGFSDIVESKRDIDTILSEIRTGLLKAGIEPPYVLLPHSMSGIEALYWASEFPEEIESIVGLDMAVPEAYEELNINSGMLKLLQFARKIGLTRFFSNMAESDAIKYGNLTEKEKDIYKALFHSRAMNNTMISETLKIKENSKKVGDKVPEIPILIFVSNGEGTGFSKDEWRNFLVDFSNKTVNKEIIYLEAPHYIHNHNYKEMAEIIKNWLK